MFGYRDRLAYFQCSACGCLQIRDFPKDMMRYYPPNYYGFASPGPLKVPKGMVCRLKNQAKRLRNAYVMFGRGILGRVLYAVFPNSQIRELLCTSFPPDGVQSLGLTRTSKILDVGCGSGALLQSFYGAGFNMLVGIDPYISSEIHYPNGVRILKCTIQEIEDTWDVIMFHHSFEHLADPVRTLQSASRLLSKNGLCLIRIPTVSSFAWEHYRENWAQLDCPRHFFLHSTESMRLLAARAGLRVERIVYDSTGFQFWGSEQYLLNIPLMSHRSYAVSRQNSIFSKEELDQFEERARFLNARGRGDQAAFFLRK